MQWVQVDEAAGGPLFDRLRVGIIEAVRDGRLPAGTRLPTVREMAGELGWAVNTVARAYRELESAGVLVTRGRKGTFVASQDPTDTAMASAARAYAEAARALGLGRDDARRYLDIEFGQPNSSKA